MALQKEGVLLAAEGASQFVAAMEQASNAMQQMIATMQKAQGINVATKGLESFSKQKDETTGNAKKSTGVFGQFFKGFGLGAVEGLGLNSVLAAVTGGIGGLGAIAGQVAIGGIKQLVGGIQQLVGGMMALAEQTAPLQGIMYQFAHVTQEVAGGHDAMLGAMRKASAGMISNRDLMQKYNSAASLVSRNFAEQMPRALAILTKTAAATGKDINYLFDSYVRGVGRASPLVLDNLEIQSSLASATQFATQMFKKQEDQLTESEKQAAMAAFTLEKLEQTYGSLPDVAESAAAQSAIFNAQMQNIKDTLGQFLLPAFTAVKQGINAVVTAFSAAISEGGGLYPIFVNLGAVLSIAADGFRNLATMVADWIGNFGLAADETARGSEQIGDNFGNIATSWIDKVGGMVAGAITWGANLVTNFAVGMIDAANTVLTWAMQQIGNILTFWLAPGSPPKILPNLDKWGMAVFEEYLKGMTKADFGILESIQGPLKKILEGPAFAGVSKAFAGALAGGDREGALAVLTKSSKIFGDDIAELARREFELADASEAVTIAENALTEAQNKATTAQERATAAQERAAQAGKKVSVETMAYNRMLREGAGQEALGGQLERIHMAEREAQARRDEAKAAQDAADAAKLDIDTAKAGVDGAKARVDVLKEQVDWQKRFLEQLFGIQGALTEQERAAAKEKATKDKGKPVDVPEPALPSMGGGFGGAIAGAIETAKQRIKESLGGIWQTIKEEFSEKWNTAIAKLGETWNTFRETVGKLWDTVMSKVIIAWSGLVSLWDSIWSWIDRYLIPIFEDLKTLGLLAVESAVVILRDTWNDLWINYLEPFWTWMSGTLIAGWEKFHTWLAGTVAPWLETTFSGVWATLGEKITEFKDRILGPIQTGLEALQGVLEIIHDRLSALITKWQEWLNRKKDETNLPESPETPYSRGLRLASEQMERMAKVSIPALNMAMGSRQQFAYQPTGAGGFYQPAATTYSTSNSFQFNTTAGNGMDAAHLEALVLRTVRRALAPGAAR